jgi:hypothetical protein
MSFAVNKLLVMHSQQMSLFVRIPMISLKHQNSLEKSSLGGSPIEFYKPQLIIAGHHNKRSDLQQAKTIQTLIYGG